MLTAYDYRSARLFDAAGVDVLLVGDSLGMVVLGYDSTIPVTIDDMLHHTRPVARAARRALVLADLPFMSYTVSREQALTNAARLIQEGGAQAVKLEGGRAMAPVVAALADERHPGGRSPGPHPAVHPPLRRAPRPGARPGDGPAPGRRRPRPGGRRGERHRPGARPQRPGGAHHRRAEDPHHRHRRRTGLRRPGAGDARPARLRRPGERIPRHARTYANLGATDRGRRPAATSPRCARATFPGEEHGFTMEESVLAALDEPPP